MTSTLPFTEEEDLASTDVLGVPAAAHITLSSPAYLETAAYGLQLYIPETHTTVSCQWHNAVLRRTCTVVSKTLMKLQTGKGFCCNMQSDATHANQPGEYMQFELAEEIPILCTLAARAKAPCTNALWGG